MDLVRKHIYENLNTCFVCTYMYKKLLFCDVNVFYNRAKLSMLYSL